MKEFKALAVIILTLVLFLVTTPARAGITGPEDRWLYGAAGYARALELQRDLKLPLVVYFYTDWCPYCQALDRDYLTAAPVQQYLRGVVKVRINPEQGPAEEEIAEQYRVTGYPAFFVIRMPNSLPRKVHPFRRGGKNFTPAEFVNACEQAASFPTPIPTTKAPATHPNTTGSLTSTTKRPAVKAQIVETPPAAAKRAKNT